MGASPNPTGGPRGRSTGPLAQALSWAPMALLPRHLLPVLLLVGLALPFLGKPVHIDDTNFLVLARGAALDPWRPHDIVINWSGVSERAFDVLSNPPGIAWWLAPWVARDAPVAVLHAAMLPWLLLLCLGAWRLGRRFGGGSERDGAVGVVLLGGAPISVLAAQALTPDLPLVALSLAGLGGVCTATTARGRRGWALVLGCAALFRYSGAALIPLAPYWIWLQGGPRRGREALLAGLCAALPLSLLQAHDLHAYGRLHVLAMVGFQSAHDSPVAQLCRATASVAALGGAAALPLLVWRRPGAALIGALAGATLAALTAWIADLAAAPALAAIVAAAAGGASLSGLAGRHPGPERRFLQAWLLLGLVFLLQLRFAASRYWLPFFAPALLAPLAAAGPRLRLAAMGAGVGLGVLLAVDDLELAQAQQELAARAAAFGAGVYAGHWGFQHHLAAAGWQPLEEGAPLPADTLLAVSTAAWPQEAGAGCLQPLARWAVADRWPGPRVHTGGGGGNLHSYQVSGHPPTWALAPWSFGSEPQDAVNLWRSCPPDLR